MKKIISTLFFIFFATSVISAEPLVDAAWLNKNLNNKNIFVLDIRNKIDGGSYEVFKKAHIPGSVHSDFLTANWRATINGVIGQFPGKEPLEKLVGSLGIDNSKHVIIVYGGVNSTDFGSAARIYWTFKTLGHDNVSILNGGFKSWQKSGYKVASGENVLTPKIFKASINKKYTASYKEVKNAKKETNGVCLIDARPEAFFKGEKTHPALKVAGRIPGAVNLQEEETIGNDGFIKSKAEILKLYDKAQIKGFKDYITYCNTGHWAATVWFALSEVANIPGVRMYDGSWAHWEKNPNNPVIKG
jgi:thiosulfate/3-mercaptopyruvate sulfurtransferase